MKMMTRTLIALLVLLIGSSAQGAVILSESFGGVGGPLDGTTTEIGGATWQAGSAFLDDGTVDTVVAASPDGQAAFVPLTPTPGAIYAVTAEITNNFSDWIAVGFMPALPPGGDWTVTDFSVRHSNNGAYAWALTRNNGTLGDQEGFNGPDTGSPAFSADIANPVLPVTLRIELDTTAATWTAEYFVNGASQGLFALDAGANSTIAGVGFSRDRNATAGTGGTLTSFTVEEIRDRVISGTILDEGTTPFAGASVSANNGGGSDTTDSNGDYAVVVPDGWTGTITPTASGYTSFPPSRNYTNVFNDIANQQYNVCQNGNLEPCQPSVPTSSVWGQLLMLGAVSLLAMRLIRKRQQMS